MISSLFDDTINFTSEKLVKKCFIENLKNKTAGLYGFPVWLITA